VRFTQGSVAGLVLAATLAVEDSRDLELQADDIGGRNDRTCRSEGELVVDCGDEHPRAGWRDLLVVTGRRLAFIGAKGSLQGSLIGEVELRDPMEGLLAAIGRGDEPGTLPPLETRNLLDQGAVCAEIVFVEAISVFGLRIEDYEFHRHDSHGRPARQAAPEPDPPLINSTQLPR
jgi:hypothetical protein